TCLRGLRTMANAAPARDCFVAPVASRDLRFSQRRAESARQALGRWQARRLPEIASSLRSLHATLRFSQRQCGTSFGLKVPDPGLASREGNSRFLTARLES